MSRRASRLPSSGRPGLRRLPARHPAPAAQTIADYSRAQRALLESTMTQAAARSAGLGASTPVRPPRPPAAVRDRSPPCAARPSLPVPRRPCRSAASSRRAAASIAEVVVNATPYLLGAGQGVPGTAWRVESVAIDRVVLSRRGGVVAAR